MRASFLLTWFLLLLSYHSSFPCKANQINILQRLIEAKNSAKRPSSELWTEPSKIHKLSSRVYIKPNQKDLLQNDKISALPGQPEGVEFDQYAGYVTVDPVSGRALFYYFVESSHNSSTKPLVLWLNGGQGCSSLGYGGLQEIGPFRVNKDSKTLARNEFSWNKVANVIFLESPAGVGFSYSNTSSDYDTTGDKRTASDAYSFLLNWLERFPHYITSDLYIAGESYAGHYIPQLTKIILYGNTIKNRTVINLQGIAIGNALLDDKLGLKGTVEFLWSHALNSDETYAAIQKYCDFATGDLTDACNGHLNQAVREPGKLNFENIYFPLCKASDLNSSSTGSVDFDPCSENYVNSYLNNASVQSAFNAKATKWNACRSFRWTDSPNTILPTLKQLTKSKISVLLYSGDADAQVSVTSTRHFIRALKLPVEKAWQPWYYGRQVGGYAVAYKGLTFVTVTGAGHHVPSYQPGRALTMIASFLQRKLPPSDQ